MLPSGSDQILSLEWALENIANLSRDEAIASTVAVIGITDSQWAACVKDTTWHIGDGRWGDPCNQIESRWNQRFAKVTNSWLDENSWHTPLWQLWLRDPKMVFAANLNYLISRQGRGTYSRLARFLGRSTTTASKWGRWREEGRKVRVPPSTAMPKLLEYFELKPSCDLYQEPLFLARAEIEDSLLRIEGKHYLNCLSGIHLKQAVERLREETVRQNSIRPTGVVQEG